MQNKPLLSRKLINRKLINRNRPVYTSFNNMELSKEFIVRIGEELGLEMWWSLEDGKQKEVLANSRDSAPADYYNAVMSEFYGNIIINVISYDPYCGLLSRGQKAIYSFNLKTGKPTRNSYIKTQLSEKLIKEIDAFYK